MDTIEYLVRSGDTLHSIAWRHNVAVDILSSLNRFNYGDINHIYVGQSLKIPKFGQYAPGTFSQRLTLRVRVSEPPSNPKYQHGMGDKGASILLLRSVSTGEEQQGPDNPNSRSWIFASYNVAEYKYAGYTAFSKKHKNKSTTAGDLHNKDPKANERYFDHYPIGKGKNTRAEDIDKRIRDSNADVVAVQEASGSEDKSRKVVARIDNNSKISQRLDLDKHLSRTLKNKNYTRVNYTAPKEAAKASHIYYNPQKLKPILVGSILGKELVGLVNPNFQNEYSAALGTGMNHKDKAYPWAIFESIQKPEDNQIAALEITLKQSLKELLAPGLLSPEQLTYLEQCLINPDQLAPERLIAQERDPNYVADLKQQIDKLKQQNISSRYIIVSSVHSTVGRKYKKPEDADLNNGRAAQGLASHLIKISNRDNSVLSVLASAKPSDGYPIYPMGIPVVIMGDMNSHYTMGSAPWMLSNSEFEDARTTFKDQEERPKPSTKVAGIIKYIANHEEKLSKLQEDPKKNSQQIKTEHEQLQKKRDDDDYKNHKKKVRSFYKKIKPYSTFRSGRVIDYIFYHYANTVGNVHPGNFNTFNKNKGKHADKYNASDHRMVSVKLTFEPK